MTAFTITREVDLPSEKLFSIISDFTRSPSPNIKVEVEKEGDLMSVNYNTRLTTIKIPEIKN